MTTLKEDQRVMDRLLMKKEYLLGLIEDSFNRPQNTTVESIRANAISEIKIINTCIDQQKKLIEEKINVDCTTVREPSEVHNRF